MKRKFLHTVFFLFLTTLFSGCSTEKNTRVSRAYHNVTSRYNIYFNGKESLKAGLERIDQTVEDDFTRILPVFKDSEPSAAKVAKSDMDNAILKASKLVQMHSITKKPKRRRLRTRSYQEFASREEFNNWVDDSYLLMGKAYFYQHNFISATDNFSQVVRKFSEEETRYDALVWLIRCYSETERFSEASEVILSLQADNSFPRRLERELAQVTADYYLKQKDYPEAIKFLDIAVKKTFWKKQKARLQYIMAQLYRETGNLPMAAEAFREVARLNPPYKMAFNARINAAGIFTGQGDVEKLKKELRRMLKDEKNTEYRDQIYFALGNIFFREGNREQAIENYRHSVATSFENDHQRALSAVTLADLYFEDRQYRESQAYYDSVMMVIDNNYPDYNKLSDRYKSLSRLVENIVTVEVQDSLQRLAKMPEVERNALIDKWVAQEQEKQRSAELLASQEQMNRGFYRANEYRFGLGRTDEGGGWYFYNPQTVSYGKAQFQQRWGRRKLEDDWRRQNKTSLSPDEMEEFAGLIDSSKIVVRVDDPLKREYYTQDLPVNDSLMALSHDKIRDALYNCGKIFKSDFNDYPRSAESFEELNRRYPQNIYQPSAYFDLYDLYELMNDQQKADYYRNLIVGNFPESKYARYLQNPNFFAELQERQDSLNRLYQDAFRDYKAGRYANVSVLATRMKTMEPDSLIIPKIDFMATVAGGVQSDMPAFEGLLKKYIATYPQAEPTPLAGEILALIQDSTLADYRKLVEMGYLHDEIKNDELLPGNQRGEDEFGGRFSYEEDLLHYFVIVWPRKADVDVNRLKFDIANYNLDHYTKIDFDIETENLDANEMMLMVRSLENKEQGLIYFRSIIRQAPVFQALKGVEYYNFIASSTNYRQIVSEKSVSDYLKFFLKNYSRFIGPDFSGEEQPGESPEELMARARREDELLKEKGTFVVVTPEAHAGAFSAQLDTTQNFVVAVQDAHLSLRTLLTQLATFNREQFRGWNLTVEIKPAGAYQLLVVRGLPGYNESMSYFRKVILERSLFRSLGQTTYRNFLITGENLQKLLEATEVEKYMEFFRTNYLQRTSPLPGVNRATQTGAATPPAPQTAPEVTKSPEKPAYTGPYNSPVVGLHSYVLLVPREGYNKEQLLTGIRAFNAAGFAALNLVTEELPFDDSRAVIRVSGLPDRETAQNYLQQLTRNRSVFQPIEKVDYRNFLITNDNYAVFQNRKNITEYMDFYKQVYLGQ